MDKIRLATVFSGIGAVEQALLKLSLPYEIVFACDNGGRIIDQSFSKTNEHINSRQLTHVEKHRYISQLYSQTNKRNYVKESYFANYEIDENSWFEDIRFIDGSLYEDKVDLYVGGSPCQSFSNMGKRYGLDDARGTLFYDYARLIKEIRPKVFVYENVPGMLTVDGGRTWETIKEIFNSLGYKIHHELLNSKKYGIPQDRKRLFVVGFLNNGIEFKFPKEIPLQKNSLDYLEQKVDVSYYLGEKGFKFVTTQSGRAKINEPIIRTQKANQQFNWNGNFVFEPLDPVKHNKEILNRAYVSRYNGELGVARLLTPRECLRLMGFSDSFKIEVPKVQAYRQSGNSIVVNVLEEIIKQIIISGVFDENN